MGVKQIIQLESETSISQVISIPFDFSNKSSLPEGKQLGDCITITPMTVRTWFKLKPYLASIESSDIEKVAAKKDAGFSLEVQEVVSKYDSLLFEIVCIGIHNQKDDMPNWFKEVLRDNCTWSDIYILLNAILFRINFNPFFVSITLLRSVSPLGEEEIIALQENRKSWNRKVTSCS